MMFLGRPLHEYAFALALFVLSVLYLSISFGYPREAREAPQLVGIALVTLSALDLVSMTNLGVARLLRRFNPTSAPEPDKPKSDVARELLAGGVILAFVGLIYLIGILPASALYIAGSMIIMGRMPLVPSVVTGALVAAFCYLLFQLALGVELYPGLLFPTGES